MTLDLPRSVVEHYETLRAHVVEERPTQDCGWAVFVRHGLLVWAMAMRETPRTEASTSHVSRTQAESMPLDRRVIQVVAGMVLQLQQEAVHGV